MAYRRKNYESMNDFYLVRDFLSQTYTARGKPWNWTIERWNFARYRVAEVHGVPISEWERGIGLWEDEDGELAALVHSEAEDHGEAFFQLRPGLQDVPWDEMFDHAETRLRIRRSGKEWLELWIPGDANDWAAEAESRGYKKNDDPCYTSQLDLPDADQSAKYPLPDGFTLGDMVSVKDNTPRAACLSLAFGHPEDAENPEEGKRYDRLRSAPDYRPELDVYVRAPSGAIVAGCLMWFDADARIGVLEPVGTVPDHRRRGFAAAVITEAVKRVEAMGADRCFVGSAQPVYQALGFRPAHPAYIWTKRWS